MHATPRTRHFRVRMQPVRHPAARRTPGEPPITSGASLCLRRRMMPHPTCTGARIGRRCSTCACTGSVSGATPAQNFLLLPVIILVQPSNEKDAKLAQKLGQLQPFALYSRRNAWANLHLSGQPKTFLAMLPRSMSANHGRHAPPPSSPRPAPARPLPGPETAVFGR